MLLLLFLFVSGAQSLVCQARYQCAAQSDYNYVDCVNSVCVCLREQGFKGDPSTGCICPTGNQLIWQNQKPYCLDLPSVLASQERGDVRINQARQVYLNLIHPTPLFVLNGSKDLNDLFAPGVIGRVDPLGLFHGHALVDYFYAFSANSARGVYAVFFKELSYNESTSSVFIRVDIQFGVLLSTNPDVWFPVTNFTQSGKYRFAPNNTIIGVDVTIHNLGTIVNRNIVPTGITYGGDRTAYLTGVCTLIFNSCPPEKDPLGYYTSVQDCISFMTGGTVRVATFADPGGNTDICRALHASIARWVPDVHCPHAGKTGGGQCVDPPYYNTYWGNDQQF